MEVGKIQPIWWQGLQILLMHAFKKKESNNFIKNFCTMITGEKFNFTYNHHNSSTLKWLLYTIQFLEE
jgi:hypothetical protein